MPLFFLLIRIFISMTTQDSRKNMSRKTLKRLRQLCDELVGRDDQLKKDLKLFEGFFSNFPIPVTMWSIGKDNVVLSKKGNAFTCEKAHTLEEIFECPELRKKSIKKHELALKGEIVSYFVENSNKLYWNKLIPSKNADGTVSGIIGIAWDVTSNSIMLHCLEKIIDLTEKDNPCLQEIQEIASTAISTSRLNSMLGDKR